MSRSAALQSLTARLRRFQLLLGLGFGAAVAGALLSAALLGRLRPVLDGWGPGVPALLVAAVTSRLWVLAVLPALCYAAARAIDLRPWRTALGTGLGGELFFLSLDLVTLGMKALLAQGSVLVLRLVTLALGVAVSGWAVRRARIAAGRAEERARKAAEANQAQYAAFLREAERLASRHVAPGAEAAAGAASGEGAPADGADPLTGGIGNRSQVG